MKIADRELYEFSEDEALLLIAGVIKPEEFGGYTDDHIWNHLCDDFLESYWDFVRPDGSYTIGEAWEDLTSSLDDFTEYCYQRMESLDRRKCIEHLLQRNLLKEKENPRKADNA